jgi:hypothetical protein
MATSDVVNGSRQRTKTIQREGDKLTGRSWRIVPNNYACIVGSWSNDLYTINADVIRKSKIANHGNYRQNSSFCFEDATYPAGTKWPEIVVYRPPS